MILFFVLSGYLITSILVRELETRGRLSLKRFYANRALRLLPAMLMATTAYWGMCVILSPYSDMARDGLNAIPSAYLHVVNWWNIVASTDGLNAAGLMGHYWSLAVEEQFYILWPLILLFAYRIRGSSGVMWVAFIGATVSYLAKWLFIADPIRQTGTDLSADALLIGCGLAILHSKHPKSVSRFTQILVIPAAIALVAALAFGNPDTAIYSRMWWPLSTVASAVLVGACAAESTPTFLLQLLEWRPLVYIGRISYGVYLWHQVPYQALAVVWDTEGLMSVPRLLVMMAASVAIAAASYTLVERRFLAMKIKPHATPAPATVTASN